MKKAIVPLGIVVFILLTVFVYINRFSVYYVSENKSYVFNNDTMISNLTAGEVNKDSKISYENIDIDDVIYSSGNKYYVGESDKKEVSLNYPIISEDGNKLIIVSDIGKYVDEDYNKSDTYKNTILSDSHLYNAVNYEMVDESNYYFLELYSGIYINLNEVTIYSNSNKEELDVLCEIPINSFIYFNQGFLRYYTNENGEYEYHEVPVIMDEDLIVVGNISDKYYDFLIKLGAISVFTDTDGNKQIEEVAEDEEPGESLKKRGKIIEAEKFETGGSAEGDYYVKPEVTMGDVSTNVYSFVSSLKIYDPANRIYRSPTFEFKQGNSTYLKKGFTSSGDIEVTGLLPDTTFEVTAYFYYKNEKDVKMKYTFYNGTITTKDISSLETLGFNIASIVPDINIVNINGIQFTNDKSDEVLKGVKTVTLSLNDTSVKLTTSNVKNLIEGNKVDYVTDKILSSNTYYTGVFKVTDIAGNELKVSGNTFGFTTLKSPPTAKITSSLSKNFTEAKLSFNIVNEDKVYITKFNNGYEYKYEVVYDTLTTKKKVFTTGYLNEGSTKDVTIARLDAETKYTVNVYCNYIDEAGNAHDNYLVSTYTFLTYDVSKLGTIKFDVSENYDDDGNSMITDSSASIVIKYTSFNDITTAYSLIDDQVIINVTKEGSNTKFTKTVSKSEFVDGVSVSFSGLPSYTSYDIEILPVIETTSGTKYTLSTSLSMDKFTTLKKSASVVITNAFKAKGYFDFDVCVSDPDGAVLETEYGDDGEKKKYVTLNVVNVDDEIVYTKNYDVTNECGSNSYVETTIEGLNDDKYSFEFTTKDYNLSDYESTRKSNQDLRSFEIDTDGTSGELVINKMIDETVYNLSTKSVAGSTEENETDIDGINVFDISNSTRWKGTGSSNTLDLKTLKLDSNELVLGAQNGWRSYSYYIPELIGKPFTISFSADVSRSTTIDLNNEFFCINNTTNLSSTDCSGTTVYTSGTDLYGKNLFNTIKTNKNTTLVYQFSSLNSSGYLTFFVKDSGSNYETTITLKDVMIQYGLVDSGNIRYTEFGGINYETEYVAYFDSAFSEEVTTISYSDLDLEFNNWDGYEYYVRFFKDGNQVASVPVSSDLIDSGLTSDFDSYAKYRAFLQHNLEADSEYEARLSIAAYNSNYTYVNDSGDLVYDYRYYDINVLTFTSEAETRSISTPEEFAAMHNYGNYIVTEDLDLCENPKNFTGTFQGTIDFQGHSVKMCTSSLKYLFSSIGGGGEISNLDLHILFNHTSYLSGFRGIAGSNYGTIQNIMITSENDVSYDPSLYTDYSRFKTEHSSLVSGSNFGLIDRVAVYLKDPVYFHSNSSLIITPTGTTESNEGTTKNIYIYGEDILAPYEYDAGERRLAVVTYSASKNATIENIYSLINIVIGDNDVKMYQGTCETWEYKKNEDGSYVIDEDTGEKVKSYCSKYNYYRKDNHYEAASVVYNASDAIIRNVLTVDSNLFKDTAVTTNRLSTNDYNIYNGSGSAITDSYYISSLDYTDSYSTHINESYLADGNFMKDLLNSTDDAFLVDDAWRNGIFPKLDWPSCMPEQDSISIPSYKSDGNIEILSVDSIVQEEESFVPNNKKYYEDQDMFGEVELSIYNPSNFKIVGLTIDKIGSTTDGDIIIGSQSTNSDKITTVYVYFKSPEVYQNNYVVTDIYYNASNNNSYSIGSNTRACAKNNADKLDCSGGKLNITLDMPLYKKVSSLVEIKNSIDQGTTNFSLINDIDCDVDNCNINDTLPKISLISGTLIGNNHVIKNLSVNNCLFDVVSGTIKDLRFENFTGYYQNNGTEDSYGGLVCQMQKGATLDGISMKNVNVTAASSNAYIGGLVGKTYGGFIKNVAIDGFGITDYSSMTSSTTAYIGGIAGYGTNVIISNSFVRNINLTVKKYAAGINEGPNNVVGIGGICGYFDYGNIENVYATGDMDVAFNYVGGITGQTGGFIKGAISYVNIVTVGDYVGGITGWETGVESATNKMSKTLVLGSLLTTKDSYSHFARTSGRTMEINNNFAWDKQSINSSYSSNTDGEILLDEVALANPLIYNSSIGLDTDDFVLDSSFRRSTKVDDDGVTHQYGYIPAILNTNTGKPLYYQGYYEGELHGNYSSINEEGVPLNSSGVRMVGYTVDDDGNLLDSSGNYAALSELEIRFIEMFTIKSIEVKYYSSDDVQLFGNDVYKADFAVVVLELNNPNQLTIDKDRIVIPGCSTEVDSANTNNFVSTINLKVTPEEYYDSYKITSLGYTINNQAKAYTVPIKLSLTFYGKISTVEDWQRIKLGLYQNYIVMNDIDFSSVDNVNYGISFNNLRGNVVNGNNPALMNMKSSMAGNNGLIDTIMSGIYDVDFNNIYLNATTSSNYFGVIKILDGTMKTSLGSGITFSNIRIDAPNSTYVGIVGMYRGTDLRDVTVNNVRVTGSSQVGGLVGRAYARELTNIKMSNVYVVGKSSYVGGIIGLQDWTGSRYYNFYSSVDGLYVSSTNWGAYYTGGAYGYGGGYSITTTGRSTTFNDGLTEGDSADFMKLDNDVTMNYVHGTYYVGGVVGMGGCYYEYYNEAYDLNISGYYGIGGVAGYPRYTYYNYSENNTITGTYYVGGVGGITGYTINTSGSVGNTITATGHSAGGVLGYMSWMTLRNSYAVDNSDKATTVTAGYYAGGIVGYVSTGRNSLYSNITNAVVSTTGSNGGAGGISGYNNNTNDDRNGSSRYSYYYDNVVANATISGSKYVGGLIGKSDKNLEQNYKIYRNTISATITCTSNTNCGYVTGGSPNISDGDYFASEEYTLEKTKKDADTGESIVYYEHPYIFVSNASNANPVKIYSKTTLNGVTLEDSSSAVKSSIYMTSNIKDTSLYTRMSNDYYKNDLSNYFPYLRNAAHASEHKFRYTYHLPGSTTTATAGSSIVTAMPNVTVYPVAADKINVEFSYVDENISFTINGNTLKLEKNTYTYYYDFKDDFTITLGNGNVTQEMVIKKDDVVNSVTVVGDTYYYLNKGSIITNGTLKNEGYSEEKSLEDDTIDDEILEDEPLENEEETNVESGLVTTSTIGNTEIRYSFVESKTEKVINNASNIYGDEILLDDQNIYNISTGEVSLNNFENLTLAEDTSLYEFTYANQDIKTYATYSIVNGEVINKQLYVKNNELEVVENSLDTKGNNYLIDSYNDKNYMIYLGSNGVLYSLKDDIKYPSGFKNSNIKNISSNIGTNTNVLFVEYNDGSYTVFNYRTGKVLDSNTNTNVSIKEYISRYLEDTFADDDTSSNENYLEAKELVNKLNKNSIESVLADDTSYNFNRDSTYSIVYNPVNNDYYVYEVPKSTSNDVSIVESLSNTLDSKIESSEKLMEYYGKDADYKKVSLVSAIGIVVGIITGIILLIIILGKMFKKKVNE